jgi:hypothetical protein
MDTRQIIDYAQNDNATEFRSALYAAVHDRIANHIESMKQGIAQNILQPQEEPAQEQEVENT